MDGYTYDWRHTLAQWVQFHFGNQPTVRIPDSAIAHESVSTPEPKLKRPGFRKSFFKLNRRRNKSAKQARTGISQGELKCHYCNLKYCLEEERTEHEKFWHNDKNKSKAILSLV